MNINFDDITLSVIPEFKGGEKEYRANMFDDKRNKIMRGKLIPGASIGMHTHEENSEIMFFTSGTGSIICDGEKSAVHSGMCHYCQKGHTHSLINDSDTDLEFFAVVANQ